MIPWLFLYVDNEIGEDLQDFLNLKGALTH